MNEGQGANQQAVRHWLRLHTMGIPCLFKVYAARSEDADKGLVWLYDEDFTSAQTIILRIRKRKKLHLLSRSVHCTYRELDHNFVVEYNERKHTRKIDPCDLWLCYPKSAYQDVDQERLKGIIVISEWCRNALGVSKGRDGPIELIIKKPLISSWASLRATCQHPDPGVRVATRVAILGTWLGIVGVLFALPDDWKNCYLAYTGHSLLWTFLVLALFCYFAGRGVKPRAGDAQKVVKAKPALAPAPSAPSGQANEKKGNHKK